MSSARFGADLLGSALYEVYGLSQAQTPKY
jgi:hypothetical protein